MRVLLLLCSCLLFAMPSKVVAQTFDEKLEAIETSADIDLDSQTNYQVCDVNKRLSDLKSQLHFLYSQVRELYERCAKPAEFRSLLCQINSTRQTIVEIEEEWREKTLETPSCEGFSLFHQPDTTLEQLIIDYGSKDFVYLIPPEIAKMHLSIDSQLPIPRESWSEMIEVILASSGVGIKQLNPFLRQVYLLEKEPLLLSAIINDRCHLNLFPEHARVCFAFTTKAQDPVDILHFLNRFTNNSERIKLQLLGRVIFICAQVVEIKELLTLYDFIEKSEEVKEYKLVHLRRMQAEEMIKILGAYFSHTDDKITSSPNENISKCQNIIIIPLRCTAQALFLMGTRDQVCRAEGIIFDLEAQLEDPREKTIYWYTCKHTQADEVADVLERIYLIMTNAPCCEPDCEPPMVVVENNLEADEGCGPCFGPPFGPQPPPPLVVSPDPVMPGYTCPLPIYREGCENFIVDLKSGSIIMVIENDYLERMIEIARKLDQPKKMVQIEVLLVEKKLKGHTNFGLNLLKIGAAASNLDKTSLVWNDVGNSPLNHGILSFFLSRTRGGGFPAYDLVYNFLLSQEDVQINACPTVTTVNQTCAKIALVEEISINTGAVQFDCNNTCVFKDAYERAQYGITIEIVPTIHYPEEYDPCNDPVRSVTLDTNIVFDTPFPSLDNRPEVIRRNIQNEIRVPDGQTVIIGGLRRKTTHDCSEKIPFLGEIPGLGAFFSINRLSDLQSEMFIFITPKIISDPLYDFNRLRTEELQKRPGDVPCFVRCMMEARDWERQQVFTGTMKMLIGRMAECDFGCYPTR